MREIQNIEILDIIKLKDNIYGFKVIPNTLLCVGDYVQVNNKIVRIINIFKDYNQVKYAFPQEDVILVLSGNMDLKFMRCARKTGIMKQYFYNPYNILEQDVADTDAKNLQLYGIFNKIYSWLDNTITNIAKSGGSEETKANRIKQAVQTAIKQLAGESGNLKTALKDKFSSMVSAIASTVKGALASIYSKK